MANSVVIQQSNNQLKVNSDAYDLSRIVGVEVSFDVQRPSFENAPFWVQFHRVYFYLYPIRTSGIRISFCVFFCHLIAFLFGAFLGLLASGNKYEFRLEFNHLDETGIQWFTTAKSRKASDYVLFKEQEWSSSAKSHNKVICKRIRNA
ncbi:hypothetical protein ACT691_03540 [Vibrio metschnikovii]